MGGEATIYDVLLVMALVGAGWQSLLGKEPFRATIFFVAYGFLLALIWVELGAPDVGLAEASVGAGLTGALLLAAMRQFENDTFIRRSVSFTPQNAFILILCCSISVIVYLGLWQQRFLGEGILPLVQKNLSMAGSSHPVTAVLLNFRALDTWFELGVLLLVAFSSLLLRWVYGGHADHSLDEINDQVVMITRITFPLLILIGGVMLWFGARDPGGAFQAGALLGASGILLQLSGQISADRFDSMMTIFLFRICLVLGFTSFLFVAMGTVATRETILGYPPEQAGGYILGIEIGATISIALTLNVLYALSYPSVGAKR